ncbi:hypothetical protein GCM10009596_15340 [Arthrobacter rhombi]|uniref:GNAT family N-acetyltransferase n=1 Tax=Arthrobacter rhombi TaxID=71253 RepID=UPI0031D3750D
MIPAIQLADGFVLRPTTPEDAAAVADAHRRNRDYLQPWEPVRPESFYTEAGQQALLGQQMQDREAGRSLPLALFDADAVIGQATLSGITHGAFESAAVGYWIDEQYQGRGIMTSTLKAVIELARTVLGLHRLEAQTLPGNQRSQRVLHQLGFEHIGFAPRYVRIAGRWQDHEMFQLILHD